MNLTKPRMGALATIGLFGVMTVIGSFVACGVLLGRHTGYCPWSHRLSDTADCMVLDRRDARVLIRHGDLDTNRYYLEIRRGSSSKEFALPAELRVEHPDDAGARLVPDAPEEILCGGKRVKLERR